MTGRFISTNSVVLNLPLYVDHLPERGESVRASSSTSRPGGGFTILSAVAAFGIPTLLAAPLGTGPNSFTVRRQLDSAGIEILADELVGDIGIALLLTERDGSTASIVSLGVEAEPSPDALERIDLKPGDMVHMSGSDLLSASGSQVLSQWGSQLPEDITFVLSISPAVNQVPVDAWQRLLGRVDILSCNIREAVTLDRKLHDHCQKKMRDVMKPNASLVRRLGVMGCELQMDRYSPRVQIPAYAADRVDTAGVGDTHVAIMCASYLKGHDLLRACQMANAAASITISHRSALPVPTPEQIAHVMGRGKIDEGPK